MLYNKVKRGSTPALMESLYKQMSGCFAPFQPSISPAPSSLAYRHLPKYYCMSRFESVRQKLDMLFCTVVTPNKGQSIFGKIGSNKGISPIPLFIIFDKWCEIRDFRSKSDKNDSLRLFNTLFRSDLPYLPPFRGSRIPVT